VRFGNVSLDEALGAILAHSVATPDGRLRKGLRIDGAAVASLRAAGLDSVIVAELGPDDVGENEAALRLARALGGAGLELRGAATGRANLHAEGPGVVRVDAEAILAANSVDPMITVATVPEWQRVAAGTMAATVKIISYGVGAHAVERACAAARGAMALVRPTIERAELIVTELEGAAGGDRAVTMRLERLGVPCSVRRVPHAMEPLRAALAGSDAPLRLVLTASATSDERDVGPAALVAAGGRLERFGMPVDPGNLLFLGSLGSAAVLGLPGCARSPALNGADWVLERIACGVPVSGAQIAAMGVGGLLKEVPTRPHPREKRSEKRGRSEPLRTEEPPGDAAK
jgi:molybdenum cofactor cytidylyltransferase